MGSCQQEKLSKQEKELAQNFDRYLTENFETYATQNKLFYILPMLGCDNCIDNHFDILKNKVKNTSNIVIILSGEIIKKKWLSDVQILKGRYKSVLFDNKDNASIYNIGLMKPVVAAKSNGKWVYYNKVEDFEMEDLVSFINQRN